MGCYAYFGFTHGNNLPFKVSIAFFKVKNMSPGCLCFYGLAVILCWRSMSLCHEVAPWVQDRCGDLVYRVQISMNAIHQVPTKRRSYTSGCFHSTFDNIKQIGVSNMLFIISHTDKTTIGYFELFCSEFIAQLP